jgi:hypothetical protein
MGDRRHLAAHWHRKKKKTVETVKTARARRSWYSTPQHRVPRQKGMRLDTFAALFGFLFTHCTFLFGFLPSVRWIGPVRIIATEIVSIECTKSSLLPLCAIWSRGSQ